MLLWTLFVICCGLEVEGLGENYEVVGEGQWLLMNVLECEDPEQFEVPVEMTRRKINRTHDAISVHIPLDRELNSSYAVEIISNKEVDGGFKFYHQLKDDSFCNLVEKHCGDNWPKILTLANVDPPQCPLPAGDFSFKDYVIDYQQLEKNGLYGTFDVSLYIVYSDKRMACARMLVKFEKLNEDGDDDEDC